MFLINITLLCAVLLGGLAFLCFAVSPEGRALYHAVLGLFGCIAVLFAISAVGVTVAYSYEWLAAGHQANIINREYGVHYTREEVFFASDVIDTVRELQRKRVEINGDLLNKGAE